MVSSKFSRVGGLCIFGVRDFLWTEEWTSFFKEFKPSGIALFNSPFDNPSNIWSDRENSLEAVYEFTRKAHELSDAFLCVDQEGGRVRRLRGAFIALPSAEKISTAIRERNASASDVEELYRLAARQLRLSNIALNFAPVCDLRVDRSSNVVGDRSYGSSKQEVLPLLKLFLQAYESEGVRTTLKHFPGHGPTEFDSHEKIAVLFKNKRELQSEDLAIFEELSPHASAIMTAHVAFADEPHRIVSLDAKLLEELGHKIPEKLYWITDDLLSMKAVSTEHPWRKAFQCRYDFMLLCGDFGQSAAAMEDLIRFAERQVVTFSAETALDTRLLRSQEAFATKDPLPPYSQWRRAILECESQASPILEKIK